MRSGAGPSALAAWSGAMPWRWAVGLDRGDCALPGRAVDVALRSGAQHGGDVLGRVDLGGDDKLALGVAVARRELVFERVEIADLLGVAVDPGHRVVVCALGDDLVGGARAATRVVGPGGVGLRPGCRGA